MFCGMCGTEIVEGSKYCPNCGEMIERMDNKNNQQFVPQDIELTKLDNEYEVKEEKSNKRKKIRILIISILLLLLIISGTLCYFLYPIYQMKECLEVGKYEEAIEIYNEQLAESKVKSIIIDSIWTELIDQIIEDYKSDDYDLEDTLATLQIFKEINNSEVLELINDYYADISEQLSIVVEENKLDDAEELVDPHIQETEELKQSDEEQETEADAGEEAEEKIHSYEIIIDDVTWTEAYEDCLNRGGYLVHINSEEEYQTIINQINTENYSNKIFWLGAKRESINKYEYKWIAQNGNPEDETLNIDEKYLKFWMDNEPSFMDDELQVEEEYVHMLYLKSQNSWVWNDVPNDVIAIANNYSGLIGYICEYEN